MSDAPPVVLVIDDDPQIRRFLRAGFELEHFKVLEEKTAEAGLHAATLRQIDLIVVDLNLPDMDGGDVVERIRAWSTIPIIVLSVRASDEDKVRLLERGADDYVVKPFSMVELLARGRAAFRRHTRGAKGDSIVKVGQLLIWWSSSMEPVWCFRPRSTGCSRCLPSTPATSSPTTCF